MSRFVSDRSVIETEKKNGEFRSVTRFALGSYRQFRATGYCRHITFGGWDETVKHRKVMGGPLVSGPEAYLIVLPTVVHNGPHEAPTQEITLHPGDRVVLDGHEYELTDEEYPRIRPV